MRTHAHTHTHTHTHTHKLIGCLVFCLFCLLADSQKRQKKKVWIVVGIVLASVCCLCCIGCCIALCCYRFRQSLKSEYDMSYAAENYSAKYEMEYYGSVAGSRSPPAVYGAVGAAASAAIPRDEIIGEAPSPKPEDKRHAKKPPRKSKGFLGLEVLFRFFGATGPGVVRAILTPFIFVSMVVMQMVTIIPYLFVLLLFFPLQIEEDTTQFVERQEQLDKERKAVKARRLLLLMLEALPMTLFLIGFPVLVVFVIIPLTGYNPIVVTGTIGSFMLIVSVVQVLSMVRQYRAFELQKKKSPSPVRTISLKNYRNYLVIAVLCWELIQMVTLPFVIALKSTAMQYLAVIFFLDFTVSFLSQLKKKKKKKKKNKVLTSRVTCDEPLLQQSQAVDLSFYLAVVIGSLLIVVYAFQFHLDMRHFWKSNETDDKSATDAFFFSFTGSLVYGHNKLKSQPSTGSLISLLVDGALVVFVNAVLNVLTCTYDVDRGVSFLVKAPTVVCWEGQHAMQSAIVLILFAYYLPLSIMVSPMLTEAGEGESSKDIKFRTSFIMLTNLLKSFIFLVPFFFGASQESELISEIVTSFVLVIVCVSWTFFHSDRSSTSTYMREPATIPEINLWRPLTFAAGCVVGVGVIIGNNFEFYLLTLLVPVIVVLMIWHCRYCYVASELQYDEDFVSQDIVNDNARFGHKQDAENLYVYRPAILSQFNVANETSSIASQHWILSSMLTRAPEAETKGVWDSQCALGTEETCLLNNQVVRFIAFEQSDLDTIDNTTDVIRQYLIDCRDRLLPLEWHENVARLIGLVNDDRFGIVFEHVVVEDGRVLRDLLNTDAPFDAIQLAVDVARGMQFLHDNSIIHGDLQPRNVWVNTASGCSAKVTGYHLFDLVTEAGLFWSPERIKKQFPSPGSDVWAYGVLLFVLFERSLPYSEQAQPTVQTLVEIVKDDRIPKWTEQTPDAVASLLKAVFVNEPGSRPNFSDIVARLEAAQHAHDKPVQE